MAKNVETKIWILRELTESQVKSYGTNIVIKTRKKYWVGLCVVLVLWEIFISTMLKSGIVQCVAAVAPPLIVALAFLYSADKAGKKLWQSLKDKEQPVKLEI
jgi:hypothetical protein